MNIEFVKLTEKTNEEDGRLDDAQQTYKEIYTQINTRGQGEKCLHENCSKLKIYGQTVPEYCLDHRKNGQVPIFNNLMGKPIQMDINNFNSLIINEYSVSTKADGERFFMMLSRGRNYDFKGHISKDSSLIIEKDIYFIDSSINFWYIKNPQIKPILSGIDKSIIDGELLIWGKVKRFYDSEGSIRKYEISEHKTENTTVGPFMSFLAFDCVYMPTSPSFEKNTTIPVLGSSAPMMGFKGADRWPTSERRRILKIVFNDSLIFKHFLNQEYFTVLVSPFVDMNVVLEHDNEYEFMINKFNNDLTKQVSKKIETLKNTSKDASMFENFLKFLIDDEDYKYYKKSYGQKIDTYIGNGASTDGLIFTPSEKSYLMDTWSFCDNRQYKWKPVNELTIDFKLGPKQNDLMIAMTGKNNYKYLGKDCFIRTNIEEGKIVETEFESEDSSKIIFNVKKIRYDKTKSNAKKTADSILNSIRLESTSKFSVILDIVKKCRDWKNNGTQLSQSVIDIILKNSSPETLNKYYITEMPLKMVSDKKFQMLKKLLSRSKNRELECRINFEKQNYPYSSLFITNNESKTVRIYENTKENSTNRITYLVLEGLENKKTKIKPDDTYIFEEYSTKNNIEKLPIREKISVALSDEIDKSQQYSNFFKAIVDNIDSISFKELYETPMDYTYTYQIRKCVTSESLFWKIDIIEEGRYKYNIDKQMIKEKIEEELLSSTEKNKLIREIQKEIGEKMSEELAKEAIKNKLKLRIKEIMANSPLVENRFKSEIKRIIKQNMQRAKENYNSGPKSFENPRGFITRIDIEYSPGLYLKQLLDLYSISPPFKEKLYKELSEKLCTKNDFELALEQFINFLKGSENDVYCIEELLRITSKIVNMI